VSGLVLRRARPGDSRFVLECRNDPEAVRYSGSGRAVADDEHAAWFTRRLDQPASPLWIGEVDGRPVGNVRLDVDDAVPDNGEVGIAVHPAARGAGHGRALLAAMLDELRRTGGPAHIVARVHRENVASLRLFRRAGFGDERTDGDFVVLRRDVEVPIENP
jgi:RimJ/RimL family protein N-acetyltransferase